jgi:uncharacterized damage-inducible protein DinB
MDPRITALRELPAKLREAVASLSDEQLNTTYREGGWTLRQVVHHIADSHLNAFIRAKLIITEDHPTVKPYDQDLWAMLSDAKDYPIESSLSIIDGVQARLAAVFESATPEQMSRTAHHPEDGELSLEQILDRYATHGEGHLQQISGLRSRKGW